MAREAGRSAALVGPLILVARVLLVGVGLLVTVVGVVFALQGVGVIGGSFMSGTTTWAIAGPVIALAGLTLVMAGLRRRVHLTKGQ